ncbi:hypothetical protein MWU50_08585 [Flavobacteriaceae bacterium S0862]|nr:hypothetical protein [Flavobacteriaceae bacterium S0862]
MNKIGVLIIYCFLSFFSNRVSGLTQEIDSLNNSITKLFQSEELLSIKLKYAIKQIKKETNDSTYMDSQLSYKNSLDQWNNLDAKLRVRGNNRLKNCYYPPIKVKISSSKSKGTLFEGNKKLKLVLPCLSEKGMNDYILKEYLAYKIYELMTPVHYKTKLLNLTYEEIKSKKIRTNEFIAFFIEDIDRVAKRVNAREFKRRAHPLQQERISSTTNDFFQYLIGNTDYSTLYQHNGKLLFIDKKIVPIPHDFDMSGLVDASYSVVSDIPNFKPGITEVTQRAYKGFERDLKAFQEVRRNFIDNKEQIFNELIKIKPLFKDLNNYKTAEYFIASFFSIIENDEKFHKYIVEKARKE